MPALDTQSVVAVVDLTEVTDKPTRTRLVELKNGKLILKQKAMSLEKMSETMQEIVKFREFIEGRTGRKEQALSTIPDEHLPLIAKLVHESDKTLHALAKYVQSELVPSHDSDDIVLDPSSILPVDAIEQAIKAVAARNNYGLESTSVSGKVPAALHLWRWEVKDKHVDWHPKAAKDKLEARLEERRQAKRDAQDLFDELPEDVRSGLLGTKNVTRTPLKTKHSMRSADDVLVQDQSDTGLKAQPQSQEVDGDKASTPKGSSRPKKPVDPEKAAKEKERLEKKAAKAEKEKKNQEAQNKSRSIMASFFGKTMAFPPKPSDPSAPVKVGSVEAGPSSARSDFMKAFKPFVIKKDAEVAPANWFDQARKRRCVSKAMTEGIIVLDDDDDDDDEVPHAGSSPAVDLGQLNANERLRQILSEPQISLNPILRQRQPRSHLKSYSPRSVKSIMAQLTEAEVTGDDDKVRALLAMLRDRRAIPVKVLIFTEDARPGYFGTWTRSSREVGPRTPFGRDVLALDYGYDSAEEWEGEDESGGDDVVEDADEEEMADGDGEDSDMDDWLVDDDEVEDPGTPVEERRGESPEMLPDVPYVPAKRKSAPEGGKQTKKRKVVVPLVPFTKGPCWESTVGQCSYEPFEAYRIELFNDTPYPINPFTYVAATAAMPSTSAAAKDRADFVVPTLPPRLVGPTAQGAPVSAEAALPSTTPAPAGPKKPAAPTPKTAFPEAHLPVLLAKINTLATSSLAYIVEVVYQDLREQRVKKNAIEAKVKEVGEKSKAQKIWVVKPEVKAAHGLA
ncbi:hypothetical protein DAEQUDRAFT_525269 [Daedalea quercina L-15889]|uniref:Chromatin assembly factor 1 subunit A dimerization domain-containing protein n=1 Tax=Daedalea quercina L-15889 TaxID=1314783 RepID=A0A165MC05_9APHY|nr:hypothetical protein DAEQUDRAFT_525269 [Daedalea quercina L-15889]